MRLTSPSTEILSTFNGPELLRSIERAARTCYKSERKITDDSAAKLVKSLIKRGHEAMLEHEKVTVKFVCDRGISHELVRHRLASFAQESTRYVNYKDGITFILPPWVDDTYLGEWNDKRVDTLLLGEPTADKMFVMSMVSSSNAYAFLLKNGWAPEKARNVLPNALKTEVVVTANLREWRHIFKLRALNTTGKAHPQMLELMQPLLEAFKQLIPVVFDDLTPGT